MNNNNEKIWKNLDYSGNSKNMYTVGNDHVCLYIHKKLFVSCYGYNQHGQLDVPKRANDYLLSTINLYQPYLNSLKWLESGPNSTCMKINERIYCWGLNTHDLWSNEYFEESQTSGVDYKYVFGYDQTICSIYNQGNNIKCWGKCPGSICNIPKNEYIFKYYKLSVGYDHACTLLSYSRGNYAFRTQCWGNIEYGKTYLDINERWSVRVIDQLVTAHYFTCLFLYSKYVKCYGKVPEFKPEQLSNQIYDISAGGNNTCAIFGGQLKCFGANNFGQLYIPKDFQYSSMNVKASWEFICAYKWFQHLSCWGLNILGQIDVPIFIRKGGFHYADNFNISIVIINNYAVGLNHSCVTYNYTINFERKVDSICWGGNNEFGENDIPKRWADKVETFALGDNFTCIVSDSVIQDRNIRKNIICYGNNEYGQNQIPTISKKERGSKYINIYVQSITAGDSHVCLMMNVSSKCWGFDLYGQTQIPDKITFRSIAAGTAHTCGIYYVSRSTDKGIVCWGMGSANLNIRDISPMGYGSISAGYDHNCFIDSKKGLVCWGENEDGQCDVPKVYDTLKG